MAEDVRGDGAGDVGGLGGGADGALDDGFVEVVAAGFRADGVTVLAAGGEDPLPHPLAGGAGVLRSKGIWKRHEPVAAGEVGLVLKADALEVTFERWQSLAWKYRASILAAFALSDVNCPTDRVHVLHSQGQCFEKTEAAAVEELADELAGAIKTM